MSAVVEAAPRAAVKLELEGMSCAGCAARIEKTLNGLDGVEATVNFATEQATVHCDPSVTVEDLIGAVESAGYDARPATAIGEPPAERSSRTRLAPLAVAVALTVPVALLAMVPALRFGGWGWVALGLSTPVVFYAGLGFHRAALAGARHRIATMDTLISLGTLAAWGWSTAVLAFSLHTDTYFEVGAVVTTLILVGRALETQARSRSSAAIRSLLELGVKEARVVRAGEEVLIPVSLLRVGDVFVVRPGEKVATDGTVVEGASAIDGSLLTGESMPVEVAAGSDVVGATVNTYGRIVVRATKVGAETALAQIARLVEAAQTGKAPIERLADRISAVFVPVVMALSLATLTGWLSSGASGSSSFRAAVAVLIVACPCALGLATPTALMVGAGRGAQLGILIRSPEVLERTRRIDTVVIDKTGTITEGKPELVAVTLLNGASRFDVLRLAGAVEAASEHPIGQAIAAAARREVGTLPAVESFRNLPGTGVQGIVEGHEVEIGRREAGIVVSWDGGQRATLTLTDALKTTSTEAIRGLAQLGLTPILLTGDAEPEARRIATETGIDRVVAGALPVAKVAEIKRLQDAGQVVAMIGDGVNDAPALAQADLGLAIGTGADVAIDAADITLVSGDLRAAVDAIRLARRTLATIRANLFWAFAYNIAALPLAVAGLLNPIIAATAMAASSLFVVTNSLRLRSFKGIR